MGTEALARLAEERVDHRFKGLPPDADGLTVGELAAQRRNLFTDGFATPVLALSAERLEHNLALMETYATRHGLAFAPHGKTTMAPQLFQRQIEHGAWGITLAVPHQVRVARAYGVQRVARVLGVGWWRGHRNVLPGQVGTCLSSTHFGLGHRIGTRPPS